MKIYPIENFIENAELEFLAEREQLYLCRKNTNIFVSDIKLIPVPFLKDQNNISKNSEMGCFYVDNNQEIISLNILNEMLLILRD